LPLKVLKKVRTSIKTGNPHFYQVCYQTQFSSKVSD